VSFATELMTILETGAGLIVGTVSDEGVPRADRAWAASIVDADEKRLRFVMSADSPDVVDNLQSGRVALTGAEVTTYQSVQLKGRPVVVEAPTAEDVELARQQSETFFDAVHRTDGNPQEALRRMLPHEMVAVEMIVEESFDQTPGPAAGGPIPAPRHG
jgi:rhamnose utilization protein RhaD (predicted bifunctional aldolase and dehydrogenase)